MNVQKGDRAQIIGGVDGLNYGVVVVVGEYMGEHSVYGPIWHIRSLGPALVTEYGAVGDQCDCADAWLRKIPPTTPPQKQVEEKELLAA